MQKWQEFFNKAKIKKSHTVGKVPKSNRKIVERQNRSPNTQEHEVFV
jgi:hypothetical protein